MVNKLKMASNNQMSRSTFVYIRHPVIVIFEMTGVDLGKSKLLYRLIVTSICAS